MADLNMLSGPGMQTTFISHQCYVVENYRNVMSQGKPWQKIQPQLHYILLDLYVTQLHPS